MDRIELTQQDLFDLLDWRDEHKELVRQLPAPLKAVEITFKHNARLRIKGIRDGNRLTLMLHEDRNKLLDVKFEIRGGVLAKTGGRNALTREQFQDVLTTYCSLMALMVYGNAEAEDDPLEMEIKEHRSQPTQQATRKQGKRNTYILRRTPKGIQIAHRGSHASPAGIFTVRRHYRHYKSGKVVWIGEYKKGTGKKKPKTYKIGGKIADERQAARDVGPAVRAGQ